MGHSMRKCDDCGLRCIGRRCQDCQYKAMRRPLPPCADCGSPLFRRSTPPEDRPEGGRLFNAHGRCASCVKAAVREGVIVKRDRAESPNLGTPRSNYQDREAALTIDEERLALCSQTDPETFFPEDGGSVRDAKKVCARCPIRLRCLEVSIENNERFGVWGGLSVPQRLPLIRAHRESKGAAA